MEASSSYTTNQEKSGTEDRPIFSAPTLSLPKGGGAIRGIGEKFAANPVTGTGSVTVPIATSPGRSGFGPQLVLSYDSGSGNGPFGFGWSLSLPAITCKTDKGLPQYVDGGKNQPDSDVYILSGAEDLVPVLTQDTQGNWTLGDMSSPDGQYLIRCYRPRAEGLFARIERWTDITNGAVHWRSISKDNITTLYGKANNSRIFDPADPDPDHPTRIFSWLLCESYDDKGNAIVYEYAEENDDNVARWQANERNRIRTANRYVKRIKYGNRTPNRNTTAWQATDPIQLSDWMFEVVFDYEEGHYEEDAPDAQGRIFAQAQITPPTGTLWPVRQDRFSTYRAGFEVRTCRRCQRMLMFHHFPQELGINDCLVSSTEFTYSESPIASFLATVIQSGYVRQPVQNQPNRYLKKSLPPLEFEYSQVPSPQQLVQQPIRDVDLDSLENLPAGLDGISYQWIDLDGEGTSGILTEQADGWYYKRNLSANNQVREAGHERTIPHFGPAEVVARKPAGGLSSGAQFLDLASDGQADLVQMEGAIRGFYERTGDADWAPFQPFVSWPAITTHDPDLKFVDLTGDGHADILINESEALTWYPSLAEAGFGPAIRVNLPLDEEKGPRLIFADSTQSIYLADLSGDGLSDLARIRNGEICYWPNLGYGHFGAKVTMDHAPWFDSPDQFDQRRIRLADIDGSGTTDILYLRADGAQIYFNQSGNSWSNAVPLPQFPRIDNISAVQALDLLGNGTACLVWSSPLPSNTRRPMRYVALMEEKPHLMIGVKNNLGVETKVHYAPSTKFYLNDKRDGKPWITRVPFPVHVVEYVETYDRISRSRFVNRYAYHHGYFDGVEREFRGFGMTEQWDTEEIGTVAHGTSTMEATNWESASFVPPVLTRTWFHTGAYLEGGRISKQFEKEYYREGDASRDESGLTDLQLDAMLLPDTVLPDGLTPAEVRQACRSLTGMILRQEIYALDKNPNGIPTEESDRPYSISERNYTIKLLQPQGSNRHAVFFAHPRETVDFHYERKLFTIGSNQRADPRVAHVLTLEVDDYGNVLKSASIAYGRRLQDPFLSSADQQRQTTTLATYTENAYTNAVLEVDAYRTPLLYEARTYELLNLAYQQSHSTLPGITNFFRFEEIVSHVQSAGDGNHDLAYEDVDHTQATTNAPYRRLIERVRALYRRNNLTGFLPLGTMESLALPGESYKLAFPSTLLKAIFIDSGKLSSNDVNNVLGTDGGYVHSQGDTHWWIPLGRAFYSPTLNDAPTSELAFARAHFFLPHRYRDPFGSETIVTYDSDTNTPSRNHNLLLVEIRDPLGNVVTVKTQDDAGNAEIHNDYRVLQPYWITDPNRNRTRVVFDALGMMVATALMGKPGANQGDFIDNTFEADLSLTQIQDFVKDPRGKARGLLKSATTRILYDVDRYQRCEQPPFAVSLTREIHANDTGGSNSPIQIHVLYSDGFGREIQTKVQAEAGEAPQRAADISLAVGDVKPGDLLRDANDHLVQANTTNRWVGTGRTVYNNKGKPVKKYEPFFSNTHLYEPESDMTPTGVTPVLFYDPVERVIATIHPNHTYEKVVFDPWRQNTWDVNDTVTSDPRTDGDVSGVVREYFAAQPAGWQTWYAQRQGPTVGAQEKSAASKASVHANTPTIAYFDTLGRPFLTVADNGKDANGDDILYESKLILDIEGNQRAVIDAKGRIIMKYDYDMLGNRVHQASMEAGERWVLNDVTGKPIRAWDSRGFMRRIIYDALRRSTGLFVSENGAERLAERTVYGESQGDANNHKARVYQVFDGAGVVTSEIYDFKGNLRQGKRELLPTYQQAVDWGQNPTANDGTFITKTAYDALNRLLMITTPDNSVYRPTFNEANLLDKVDVNLRGAGTATPFVTNIDYNAKGQRTFIRYGNGAETTYKYDDETFRLIQLKTTRSAGLTGLASQLFANLTVVQDLRYTYDPIGNIASITDDAIPTVQYNSQQVDPDASYVYDAIYRLISANGREQIGQAAFDFNPSNDNYREYPFVGLQANPNDPKAVRNYTETYDYDEVGNINSFKHAATGGNWTRTYTYNESSLLETGKKNNRLTRTQVGNGINFPETYSYTDTQGDDIHGCMTAINSMQMIWDFEDQLQMVDLGGGGKAYYVYDAAGQRVRKVIHNQNGKRTKERIYLGGFEVYREYNGASGAKELERETLHIMDDMQRIALVETKTMDVSVSAGTLPETLIRYQFGNHLGSAALELDEQAEVITYEEYHPYGTSSYQAVRSQTETSRRYRYTGKERDEETGLYYHGARYYASWLGRWTACDPKSIIAGPNLYEYVRSRPSTLIDPHGDIDDEAKEALRGLQKLVDAIPQREFKRLGRAERGTRAHLTLESLLHVDPSSPAKTPLGMRLAPEMLVDRTGTIVGFGDPGKFGKAMEGGRTIDVALLSEATHNLDDLVKNKVKAIDVVLAALDYKTGKARLKNVGEMEALINAPYVKLVQKGDVLTSVETKLAASPKKFGNKKLITTLVVVAAVGVATPALAAGPEGQSAPAPAVAQERTPEQERLLNKAIGSDLAGHTMSQETKHVQDIGEQSIPLIDRFSNWLKSPWFESSDQLAGGTGTSTQKPAQKELKPGQTELLESMKKAKLNQPVISPY